MNNERNDNVILDQKVLVTLSGPNINHYRELGYENLYGRQQLEVDVFDLSETSRVIVKCKCDFCGKEFERPYILLRGKEKHSCGNQECKKLLRAETCMERYGVSHVNKVPSIKQKGADCFAKRYGKSSPIHSEFVQKRCKTNLEKFGNASGYDKSKSHEIRSKAVKTMLENTRNATCRVGDPNTMSSKEQVHICELLDGILNHIVSNKRIDIALDKDMIAVEYDGGGHQYWNGVYNDNYDQTRDEFLLSQGWKTLRIIYNRNFAFPSDSEFLKIVSCCKEVLKTIDLVYVDFVHHAILFNSVEISLSESNTLDERALQKR